MKKLYFLFVIMGIIVCAGIGLTYSHASNHVKKQVLSAAAMIKKQPTPTLTLAAPGVPLSINIPKIHVQAKIESVTVDSQGRMAVPKDSSDTAWYSPGFRPGMNGNAVIDGHLDRVTGAPAVFWNLHELQLGDTIQVWENNGREYTFAVNMIAKYPYNQFPLQEVFGKADTPMLNLITCNGAWDQNSKNYSDRLVVYSKLVAIN